MTSLMKSLLLSTSSKLGLIALCLCFSACKGTVKPDDVAICASLNNQTFFTESLGEGGRGLNGIWLNHWRVQFSEGDMTMSQSDFGLSGRYTCVNGEVLLTSVNVPDRTLNFSHDFKTLYFDPFSASGEPSDTDRVYVQAPKDFSSSDWACEQVRGKIFIEENFAAVKYSDDPKATMLQMALPFGLTFSEGQEVEVVAFGENYSAIYDCDLANLHVHKSESDRLPLVVNMGKGGLRLNVEYEGQNITLVEDVETSVICTTQYDPVCAAKNTGIQCVTTPCPTEVYQTYSNQCNADANGSRVLFSKECGELEGQPVEVGCGKDLMPVCGAVESQAPCTIMPCPSRVWTSFDNQCFAQQEGASHILDGSCASENDIVRDLPAGICTKEYFPVCAKRLVSWECQGETPCFTHQYQTYGNACEAREALAENAFDGVCGDLDETWAHSQPLVKMVDGLPNTNKLVTLSEVSIDGDVVHLKLAYSGCSEQHFDFQVSTAFLESFPVQVNYVFTPQVEDGCLAAFQTAFEYDLIPLKTHYQKAYQSQTGSISLGELGLYVF